MEQKKRIQKIEDFEVYQKAVKLFHGFMEEDFELIVKHFGARELARQQIKSLDSICSNMEEGYARKAGKELKQFFRISRGSTAESKGRYKRLKKFLPEEVINKRVAELDGIQAMLHSLISKLHD